jgi:iron(III) transport system ATP-binding protein
VLSVRALCTEYASGGGAIKAAQNVSFEVPRGKLFTLLGPSGCGKTTTLRSVAGLEKPTSGEISIDRRLVYSSQKGISVAPRKRNIGMVFQSYAIWPHMNVFQNVAFPLEVRRLGRRIVREKVMRMLDVVALEGLADRDATRLSGGQQQRLALARALVMEPQLLLLDEPLSNLDAKLRDRMRLELKRLQRELELTTVYVTHDQTEALALSHEIAVMNEGRIVQIGTPRQIYENPRDKFVADFVGSTNLIPGTVSDVIDSRCTISSPLGQLRVQASEGMRKNDSVLVSVRPENVELSQAAPAAAIDDNVCKGVISSKEFLGDSVDCHLKVGEVVLLARAHPAFRAPDGDPIYVRMRADKCIAIAVVSNQ